MMVPVEYQPRNRRITVSRSVHTLSIPSSTRYLEDVRRFVEHHASEANFSDQAVTELKIAVDEACANVIEHAYSGDQSGTIDVDVIIKPDKFTVRIRDEGQSFDEDKYQKPDILDFAHKKKSGGFGVQIMKKLMDRVEYRTRGKSNECCLIKYREAG